MIFALNEVKIQAKLLQKALQTNPQLQLGMKKPLAKLGIANIEQFKFKHSLTLIAQQLGFLSWHQAHEFLSGEINNNQLINAGAMFYPKRGDVFLNEWFANYDQAKVCLSDGKKTKWLFPFKQQYVVVEQSFVQALNLDESAQVLWSEVQHNMVASYGTNAWDSLACNIIKNRTKPF